MYTDNEHLLFYGCIMVVEISCCDRDVFSKMCRIETKVPNPHPQPSRLFKSMRWAQKQQTRQTLSWLFVSLKVNVKENIPWKVRMVYECCWDGDHIVYCVGKRLRKWQKITGPLFYLTSCFKAQGWNEVLEMCCFWILDLSSPSSGWMYFTCFQYDGVLSACIWTCCFVLRARSVHGDFSDVFAM